MHSMPDDFPPVPKCFSQLVSSHIHNYISSSENEDQAQFMLSQSLPPSLRGRSSLSHEPNNNWYFRSLSESSNRLTDQSSLDMDQDVSSAIIWTHERGKKDHDSVMNESNNFELSKGDHKKYSKLDKDLSNPFVKLNSSLEKLQKEMKELRLFDVSLFCQLLSLNDAIQDMKFNIGERYSETGSEYSLGSASCMGSMSSLDEESDWGENVFANSLQGGQAVTDEDENCQSTSTLLEQITALTQRAEED